MRGVGAIAGPLPNRRTSRDRIRHAGRAYCAITGGRYAITSRSGASDEQGMCTLPEGKSCDAEAYYRGTCRA